MKEFEKLNKSNYPIETIANQYLKVSNKIEQVYFSGMPGAKVMEDLSIAVYKLRVNRPSLVIMDIRTK